MCSGVVCGVVMWCVVCGGGVVVVVRNKKPCKVWLLHCKITNICKKRLLQIKINRKQYRLINIAKGTTDLRVISQVQTQILITFHLQNLD